MIKQCRYVAEAILVYILYGFFKLFPPHTASAIGGCLGRLIGMRLSASRKALRHIECAFPDKNTVERKTILRGMWDNLGRLMAEYAHVRHIAQNNVTIEGYEHFEKQEQAIFIAAHMANWEVMTAAAVLQNDLPIDITYRAPNNPMVDRILMKTRSLNAAIPSHAKSSAGGRGIMQALKNARSLGILIDQKYNEGRSVPFFGHDAMTNPIFVQLVQKYKCPLLPVQYIRHGKARFTMRIHSPLSVFNDDGSPRAVDDVILDAHTLLEGWISERPEQWLWLHKRWKV